MRSLRTKNFATRAARIVVAGAALVAAPFPSVHAAEPAATGQHAPSRSGDPASQPGDPTSQQVQSGNAPDAPAVRPKRKARAAKLRETSTLAEWKAANAAARSEVAVAIARRKLPPTATRLEVATAAMEISGCLTKTAGDARFDAWQVESTATTCLTAPERPSATSK